MDRNDVFGYYRRLAWGREDEGGVDQDRVWKSMLTETEYPMPNREDEFHRYNESQRGEFNRITNELMKVGVLFPSDGGKIQVAKRDGGPSPNIVGYCEYAELMGSLFIRVHAYDANGGITVADFEYMNDCGWDYIADGVFRSVKLRS